MKRKTLLGLSLLLLIVTFAGRAADVDYAAVVAEAAKTGDMASVSRLCRRWAAAEPGDERPRIILGRTLLEAGMTDRALEQFELAVEANPLSPVPRCELGLLFLRARKPDMAAKEFGESLRIDPTYLPAQLGKARVKLAEGEADEALRRAKEAVRSNPENVDARALVARSRLLARPWEGRRGVSRAGDGCRYRA
ncbi:MAG: tetratricopeptide repeat protein [Lentisphaerae bacterium]|jgi:tetratricopeptide (TPR) repeat protein|nr:tetratricopeptide repeat protein [Lentisphaerota bacterium]MBT5610184.1 tetratricopeptide repeat protein [Lentisphaerota bacterium]MBT7057083.1 tetratricopeptide repeat protein [Lentisphaerota bacterium]MBT7846194.1 tetratricopeptide repeat protein [Lentisphaerota bacterium]